jgi:hypothetical protein
MEQMTLFNEPVIEAPIVKSVEEIAGKYREPNRTPMKNVNSIEAGKSMSIDEKESRRNQVCEFFMRAAEHGLTDCELYECFRSDLDNKKTTESTLRWRRQELEEMGTVILTGEKRKTSSGRGADIRIHKLFIAGCLALSLSLTGCRISNLPRPRSVEVKTQYFNVSFELEQQHGER